MKKTRILLVDDTRLVNEGISSLLSKEADWDIVGNVFSGEACLDFLQENTVDVVLLDHQMPGLNGLQTLSQIRQQSLTVKVILLTLFNEKSLIQAYLEVGIEGCLLKNDSPHELVFGIRQVILGERFLSSMIAQLMASTVHETVTPGIQKTEMLESLTKAERQVLAWIGKGLSVEEISTLRHTSVKTVSRQKQNIMDKLNIHKETKLMRFAIDHGIA